jgi:hypothetical protein
VTLSFFNGPVQNGDFTFSGKPGKAVGIRIAEALNRILGFPPVPQLWNTVRLAGDLRYRRHTATAAAPIPRPDFEAALIAAKYDTGWGTPPAAPPPTPTTRWNGVRADQLPALLTYFRRAAAIAVAEPDQAILDVIRRSIVEGDTDWLGSRSTLATAMAADLRTRVHPPPRPGPVPETGGGPAR